MKSLKGFIQNNYFVSKGVYTTAEEHLRHLLSYAYHAKKGYFRDGRTLLFEATIASYQDKNLPILEKYGFEVVKTFTNANSGNKVYVMLKEMGKYG